MAKKPQKQTPQNRPRDNKGRFVAVKVVAKPTKTPQKKSVPVPVPVPVPVAKIKDAKKVAAGKARQAAAIKDERGRFASKIYVNEIKRAILATKKIDVSKINAVDNTAKIDELIKGANITPAQVKKFYESKKFAFEDMIKKGGLTGTSKNSGQLEKAIDKYKGKILIQNEKGKLKEYTKAGAKFQFVNFINGLKSEINMPDLSIKPFLSFDGKMQLKIPNIKTFLKDVKKEMNLEQGEEISDRDSAEINEALQKVLKKYYGKETDINFYIS